MTSRRPQMAPTRRAFHVYDTTLRDGAQQEGLTLSVEDKLAIARHLDELGVGFIEGGWPGANPKDTEFFRAGSDRARPEARAARRVRRDPPTRCEGRRRPAGGRSARLRCAGRDAGRQEPRPARRARAAHRRWTRTSRWSATRWRTCGPRGAGCSSTPSTSSTATAATRRTPSRCCATAAEAGADVVALCDTNGGMLPDEVADVVARRARGHRRPARHPLPQRHRLRGRQLAGRGRRRRDARAGHAQRLRRAHRQRRPRRRRRQPRAQARPRRCCPTGALREATRIAHAVSEVTNVPPYSRQPYVGASRVRPQGRAARERDQGRPDALPARGPRGCRQRHADARLRHGRPAPASSSRAASSASTCPATATLLAARHRPGQGPGGARLHLRGGRRVVRAAAARGGRGAPADVLRGRVVAGHRRVARRRVRGDAAAEATVKVRAGGERLRRDRRGQRTGQRARPRAAQALGQAYPELEQARADRLQGAHRRRRRTAPTP